MAESTLMISSGKRLTNSQAIAVLPEAVGPIKQIIFLFTGVCI